MVAVGGISNGGRSAFRAALDRPKRYVALVTVPGAPPNDADRKNVPSLARMRVGFWVGENDSVWRQQSEDVANTLQSLSSVHASVELQVVKGQDHIIQGIDPVDIWREGKRSILRRRLKSASMQK